MEERLSRFPIEWLENVDWLINPVDYGFFKSTIAQIADDFLLGKDNSLSNKDSLSLQGAKLIE